MKRMFLFLAGALLPIAAAAQGAFLKFESDVNVTSVVVGPKTFAIMKDAKWKDGDKSEMAAQLLSQMKELRVYETKVPATATELKSAFQSYSKSANLEPLIRFNDSGNQISIMVKEGSAENIISELLVLAEGKGEFVVVSLTGEFDLDQVSRILSDKSVSGDKQADAKQFNAIKKDLQLKVSPNPASDVFYLDTDDPVKVSLYDFSGKLVKSGTNSASGFSVADLPKGTYLLEMTSGDKKQTEKLIVK